MRKLDDQDRRPDSFLACARCPTRIARPDWLPDGWKLVDGRAVCPECVKESKRRMAA